MNIKVAANGNEICPKCGDIGIKKLTGNLLTLCKCGFAWL